MAFYCRADDRWVLGRLSASGRAEMAALHPDRSQEWQSLGVSILHELVMTRYLTVVEDAPPKYVRTMKEFVIGLRDGDSTGRDATGQSGSGQPFELACVVMPATLDHIRAISEHNERMPAKSTYFYPKLQTGLVVNPFD